MFDVLEAIGRAVLELVTLVLVVVWWAQSGRGEVTGRQWCDSRECNRRDHVFLAATALMFVFSFGTFYRPGGMFIRDECGTYANREADQDAVTTAPEALCRDAVIAHWRRDAWGHFSNWCPVVVCVVIAVIIALRRVGFVVPWLARPVTRGLMFLGSLAAVFSIYGTPYVAGASRGWALWAVTVLTVVNVLAVMRSRSLMRWLTN